MATAAPARRRGKGTGTIYQRRDGAWIGELTVAGRRRRVTAPTEELAAFRLKSLATEHLPDRGDGTVGGWLRQWLIGLESGAVRPSTLIAYRRIVAHHLIPDLGRIALSELRPAHVRGMLARLAREGLGESTRRNVRNVLSGALEVARNDDLIAVNPARVPVPVPKYRSTAEAYRGRFIAILEAVQDHPYGDFYWLLAYTGLRSGEALALRWSDVDLGRAFIKVSRTITRKPDPANPMIGRLAYGPPKGGDTRIVPIPLELGLRLGARAARASAPLVGLVFPSASDPSRPIEQSHALHASRAHFEPPASNQSASTSCGISTRLTSSGMAPTSRPSRGSSGTPRPRRRSTTTPASPKALIASPRRASRSRDGGRRSTKPGRTANVASAGGTRPSCARLVSQRRDGATIRPQHRPPAHPRSPFRSSDSKGL